MGNEIAHYSELFDHDLVVAITKIHRTQEEVEDLVIAARGIGLPLLDGL